MIEKSCLDCGHRKICGRFGEPKKIILLFLAEHPEQISDDELKEAISSLATCFGTICVEWLSKRKEE